jgi:hypothetical protein
MLARDFSIKNLFKKFCRSMLPHKEDIVIPAFFNEKKIWLYKYAAELHVLFFINNVYFTSQEVVLMGAV